MSICPICKTKLLPVIHGRIDKDVLDMQDKGLIVIGSGNGVNSYCPLCEEAYGDFTDLPVHD